MVAIGRESIIPVLEPVEYVRALGLLSLGERWPPQTLKRSFSELRRLAESWAAYLPWPAVMQRMVEHLYEDVEFDASNHDRLRSISAAISMLVHLRPVNTNGSICLVNDRRRRTGYGSYPTPAGVATSIAQYVWSILRHQKRSLVVLDPTIEGAPLLLECARLFAGQPNIQLMGIDRSIAAVKAVEKMFCVAAVASPQSFAQPHLINGEATEVMDGMDSIDALINNPPWGKRSAHTSCGVSGAIDPCSIFVERGLKLLNKNGPFGLVLPGQVATAKSAGPLRKLFNECCVFSSITTLPRECFPRATVRALLLLGRKSVGSRGRQSVVFVHYPLTRQLQKIHDPVVLERPQFRRGKIDKLWGICANLEAPPRLRCATVPLESVAAVWPGIVPYRRGRGRPVQTRETLDDRPYTSVSPKADTVPVIRSRQIRPYICDLPGEHVILGPHLAYLGPHGTIRFQRRVFVREICGREGTLVAAPAPVGVIPRYGVFSLTAETISAAVLCAILNSSVIAHIVRTTCDGHFKESFHRIRINDVRKLPISVDCLTPGPKVDAIATTFRRLRRTRRIGRRLAIEAELDELVALAYGEGP